MRDIRWISTHPDGGQIYGMIDAVFPILKQRDKNQWGVMGTGFFVTHFGLFFTTAHVFYGRDIVTDRDQLFIPHMLLEERSYILRRIVWAYGHDVTDIAVGMAEPISMHENGEAIINRALLLVAETPSVGETVFSYGHPCTEVIPYMQDIDYLALLHLFTTEGIVQQHFPNGRDSIVQPGCCIETNLLSYGGSSGSPVMDSHGRVFAVISSGLGENITYAAPIADILNTEIPVFFENNPHRINRVRDCLPFGGMAPTRGDGE